MSNIVISTGAGISAESGVQTFRDPEGLWAQHDPMKVAHVDGWRSDPQKVLDFYNTRRAAQIAARHMPNPAHEALTRLQREWHGHVTIITQNIDGLHRAAGSVGVLEMHGNGTEKRCEACGYRSAYDRDIILDEACVTCGAVGTTRPNVVLFGEEPFHLNEIERRLLRCDRFTVIGSSLEVSPANSFVYVALANGADTVLINKEVPDGEVAPYWTRIYGNASVEVPAWVDTLLS